MQGVGVVAAAWRIALLLLLFPTLSLTQGGRALLEGIPSIYFGLLARLKDRCTVLAHLWLVVFSIPHVSSALVSCPSCFDRRALRLVCMCVCVCVCVFVRVYYSAQTAVMPWISARVLQTTRDNVPMLLRQVYTPYSGSPVSLMFQRP